MSEAPQSSFRPKTVAIISKPGRPELSGILPSLHQWLSQRSYKVMMDRESAQYFSAADVVSRSELGSRSPDLALVLGGDGTLLSAARAVCRSGTLILGVNLGTLGFLTELALADLYPALEAIEKGQYMVDSRAMLSCSLVRGGGAVATHIALNDVVVSKSAISRLNYFELFVDQEFVSSYKADALIVATPTGSTAYSLAAGGAVAFPTADVMALTPICPHTLTNRSLILPMSVTLEVRVITPKPSTILSTDGQMVCELTTGDLITIKRSRLSVRLMQLAGSSFCETLRKKLHWRGGSL